MVMMASFNPRSVVKTPESRSCQGSQGLGLGCSWICGLVYPGNDPSPSLAGKQDPA